MWCFPHFLAKCLQSYVASPAQPACSCLQHQSWKNITRPGSDHLRNDTIIAFLKFMTQLKLKEGFEVKTHGLQTFFRWLLKQGLIIYSNTSPKIRFLENNTKNTDPLIKFPVVSLNQSWPDDCKRMFPHQALLLLPKIWDT